MNAHGPVSWRDWLIALLAVLACCLGGCAAPEQCTVGAITIPSVGGGEVTVSVAMVAKGLWVDPALPQEATQRACAVWSRFGLTCEPAASQESAWIQVHAGPETDCEPDAPNHVWLGSASWRTASIRLVCFLGVVGQNPDITRYYTAAVAHEIGHTLGLQHVDDETALMYPVANPTHDVVTDADAAEFRRVWGDLTPP